MIEFDERSSTEMPTPIPDDVSIESQWSDEHMEINTGSLNPAQSDIWPVILRYQNGGSNHGFGTTAWTCSRCDYRNLDVLNCACDICGMRRASPKREGKKNKLVPLSRGTESRRWRTPSLSSFDIPLRQKSQVHANAKQLAPFTQHTLSAPHLALTSLQEQQQARTSPTLSSHFSKNEKVISLSSSLHSDNSTVTMSNLARDQFYRSRQFQEGIALEKGSSVLCNTFDESKTSSDEGKRGGIRAPQPAMDSSELDMRTRFPKNETRRKHLLLQGTDHYHSDKYSAYSGIGMEIQEKSCNSTMVIKIASEDVLCRTYDNDLNTMEAQTNQNPSYIWEIQSSSWKLDDVETNSARKRCSIFSNQSQPYCMIMFSVGLGIVVMIATLSFIVIKRFVSYSRLPISVASP